MAIVDNLKWLISADSQEFRKEIARSDKSLKRGSRNMDRSLQRLNRGFAGMKTQLLGLLGVAGFGALINDLTKTADETGKLAKQLGTTSEELSTLTFAAEQNGASLDDVRLALRRLARGIDQAEEGTGSYGKLFKELGIQTRDTNGEIKSTTEVLAEVADLFQTLPDGAQKTAIAYELLGDNGQRLIPLLNQGSAGMKQFQDRARELGLEISQNTADAAAEFRDQLSELRAETRGLGLDILTDALPSMNEFVRTVRHAREQSGTLMAVWVALGGIGQAIFGETLQGEIEDTKREIEELEERLRVFEGLSDFRKKLALGFDKDEVKRQLQEAREELAKLEAQQEAQAESERKRREEQKAAAEEEARQRREAAEALRQQKEAQAEAERQAEEAKKRVERGEQAIAQLQREVDLFEKLTHVEQIRWEIANGRFADLEEAQQKRLMQLAQELDALERNRKAEEEAKKKAEQAAKQIEEFQLQAARNIQSHFADFLFDPFDKGLEGMVRGFADSIRRMLSELLAAQALKAAFSAFGVAVPGFAEGGPVHGPGTSTSDSIPARLSAGEFVQPANTTSHYGADFMEALRQRALPRESVRSLLESTARMRPRIPAAPRFAEGGLAAGAGAAAQSMRLVLVDDRASIGDYLSSAEGEKTMVEFVRRNRMTVRRLIGG